MKMGYCNIKECKTIITLSYGKRQLDRVNKSKTSMLVTIKYKRVSKWLEDIILAIIDSDTTKNKQVIIYIQVWIIRASCL